MGCNKRYLTSLNFVYKIYELILLVAVVALSGANYGGDYWGRRNQPLYLWTIISCSVTILIHLILAVLHCTGGGNKKAFRIAELVFYILFAVHHLILIIVLLASGRMTVALQYIQLLVGVLLGLYIMDIMCKVYEWRPLGDHDYQDPPEKPQVPPHSWTFLQGSPDSR